MYTCMRVRPAKVNTRQIKLYIFVPPWRVIFIKLMKQNFEISFFFFCACLEDDIEAVCKSRQDIKQVIDGNVSFRHE